MRDYDDNNDIWAETIRIMRSRVSEVTLQLPNLYGHPNATSNLSRFLQKLELCSGENAEVLHDHLKVKEFGGCYGCGIFFYGVIGQLGC